MSVGVARILYVGHATVLVDMDGVQLLTDPLLRPRLMHLRRVGRADERALHGIDAVLISHLHFDHLDFPSLERLGHELPLVVPQGAGQTVRRRGFRAVTELGVGEKLAVGPLEIEAVRAVHDSARRPFGVRAEPIGYVIRGSRSVYFAGDTEVFDGMAELAPVDLALLPIWGWGPALGGGHMDPEAAVKAALLLGAAMVVPIHWGTYFPAHLGFLRRPGFIDTPAEEFESRIRTTAPSIEVRVLRPGAQTVL